MWRNLIAAGVVLGLLLVVTLWLAWSVRCRPENAIVVAAGSGEIRIDDFAFGVAGSRMADQLGNADQPAKPQGRFCVVTLEVRNRAKRIDLSFTPNIVRLVDSEQRIYRHSPAGQAALDQSRDNHGAAALPAGSNGTTEVVFDVPADARGLCLKVQFESQPLLNMLDTLRFGEQRIRLDGGNQAMPGENAVRSAEPRR